LRTPSRQKVVPSMSKLNPLIDPSQKAKLQTAACAEPNTRMSS